MITNEDDRSQDRQLMDCIIIDKWNRLQNQFDQQNWLQDNGSIKYCMITDHKIEHLDTLINTMDYRITDWEDFISSWSTRQTTEWLWSSKKVYWIFDVRKLNHRITDQQNLKTTRSLSSISLCDSLMNFSAAELLHPNFGDWWLLLHKADWNLCSFCPFYFVLISVHCGQQVHF